MPRFCTENLIDMSKWNVTDHSGMWMGEIDVNLPPANGKNWHELRYIKIMPSTFPWEVAVDALLDFMDRLRTGNVPRDITEPLELMEICVRSARRQR